MIRGVLPDPTLEVLGGFGEVALDEGEDAEGQGDLGVAGLEGVSLNEGVTH